MYFWDQDPVIVLLRMYSTRLNGPWSEMRQSRCEFVAAIKGLCTEECVRTALVAVLVSRDLSLYIVYIV